MKMDQAKMAAHWDARETIDRLRAENERLREAIGQHRAEILFDGESKFDVNEADERLWRLITPAAIDEQRLTEQEG